MQDKCITKIIVKIAVNAMEFSIIMTPDAKGLIKNVLKICFKVNIMVKNTSITTLLL